MESYAITHCGNVRVLNEDAYFLSDEGLLKDVFVVADGMGGHRAGEVASQTAVEAVMRKLTELREAGYTDSAQALRDAMQEANQIVLNLTKSNHAYKGMGTTMTAAITAADCIHVVHIGDSRAYLFQNNSLRQLTKDHSLVQDLFESGQISAKEAREHPQRNIITRALGTSEFMETDIHFVPWQKGNILLLCSDGLTSAVEDVEMALLLKRKRKLSSVANALLSLALQKGGRDNITVLLVRNTEGGSVR